MSADFPAGSAPGRIRILVAAATAAEPAWTAWQSVRDSSPNAKRMVLQRISRKGNAGQQPAVGLGYGENLRWFGPVAGDGERRLILAYAQEVLAAEEFPPPGPELRELAWLPETGSLAAAGSHGAGSPDGPMAAPRPEAAGIILLSHAETDLLALERARTELPSGFPMVAGHSLIGIATPLAALFGSRRSSKLVAIVRVHGAASTVPGLAELIAEAHKEGWAVVVISGVGGDPAVQPRTSNIAPALASALTSYFTAGGVNNVVQALRYVAHEQLGLATGFEPPAPMPSHGLYHPDLLVTSVPEWQDYRAPDKPVAIVLFYRAHVLSGNLEFIDQLVRALECRGFAAVGVFTSSLRDRDESGSPAALQLLAPPAVIVNTVSFPMLTLTSLQLPPPEADHTSFEAMGVPIIQAICCGSTRAAWSESARGLSPSEAAMNIALPECDGRVIVVPISFKENHR
jgi:cobaltochelatase CobN